MNLVFLGRVGRPHGIAGEFYVDRCSLTSDELKAVRDVTWRGREGATRTFALGAVRATHDRLLVRFAGIGSREAASELTNGELWGDSERLPDPGPGVVYTFQLVGLRVIDAAGNAIGTLRDVNTSAAQPLYVIDRDGTELLVPGIEPFVKKVDLAAGTITMELPAGIEDLGA